MTGGLLRGEQGEVRYERHDGDTGVRNWSDHNKAGETIAPSRNQPCPPAGEVAKPSRETMAGVEPWLIRV